MKKILLIALVIAIATAFVFTAVQATYANSFAASGSVCPNVGWNSRSSCASYGAVPSMQSLALIVRPPLPTPNVGWNS
jgi:hypothetical protein